MIPCFSFELKSELPPEHTGWTPKKDDVSEEGLGGYRGTRLIQGEGVREARRVIAVERTLIALTAHLSADPGDFERVASALESEESETFPERLMESGALAEVEPCLGDGSPVDGLELGVAGLVYALAAAGCWTAASCRGHPGEHAWPLVQLYSWLAIFTEQACCIHWWRRRVAASALTPTALNFSV